MLEAALAWAHAHVVSPDADPGEVAGWRSDTVRVPGTAAALFGERAVPIAGAGTPLVAEFCVLELAAVLDLSHEATLALLGDVLDLAHRLPRVWALVRALRVPVHLARSGRRRVAATCPWLRWGMRTGCWRGSRVGSTRTGSGSWSTRPGCTPTRTVRSPTTTHALAARRVEVHHEEGAPGTSEVFMTLDTADAVAFDHTVSTMAATMRSLGHEGELGVRRAHAVGVLADPQAALDLLAAADLADPDRAIDPEPLIPLWCRGGRRPRAGRPVPPAAR